MPEITERRKPRTCNNCHYWKSENPTNPKWWGRCSHKHATDRTDMRDGVTDPSYGCIFHLTPMGETK